MKTPEQLKGGHSQTGKGEGDPCTGNSADFYV